MGQHRTPLYLGAVTRNAPPVIKLTPSDVADILVALELAATTSEEGGSKRTAGRLTKLAKRIDEVRP